jgi:hypothetical protein
MAHKFYFQMVQLQMGRKIVPAVGKLRNNPAGILNIGGWEFFYCFLNGGGGEEEEGEGGYKQFYLVRPILIHISNL